MSGAKEFAQLAELTGGHFRAAQAEFAGLLERETRLRQNLSQLIENRQSRVAQSPQPGDVALIAGADMRWQQWVDQRRAVINGELARVMAMKESCRAKLKLAFGRDQATKALQKRAAQARLQTSRRRGNYES